MNEQTTPTAVTRKRGMRDNRILRHILEVILYPALFIGALLVSASMTFDVIGMILPGHTYMQALAIGFFDGGALVWWLMYIIHARGTPQRAASLVIFGIDLLGAVTMILGDLYLGGQQLVTPPAWLGKLLINGTTLVMAGNLIAGYYYHANSPEGIDDAQNQDLEDDIAEAARAQARANVEREAPRLGAVMATRATARLKARLALPMTEAELAAWNGEVIEGQVSEAPALPAPNRLTFWEAVKSFFGRGRFMPSQDTHLSKNSPDLTNPQPQDEPSQDNPQP